MYGRTLAEALFLAVVIALPASAQSPPGAASLTFNGGYTGFVDEGPIHHTAVGAGAEWILNPRIAVGPEVRYLVGPGDDRDLFVLGVVRFGLRRFDKPVVPFAVLGGGLMRHSDRFNGSSFSAVEGAFVAGGGVRVAVTPRVFVAPEFSIGWEPHMRVSVTVGVGLP